MRHVIGYFQGMGDVWLETRTLPWYRKIPAYAMLGVLTPIMAFLMPVILVIWALKKGL